jgi:hypothetical protein
MKMNTKSVSIRSFVGIHLVIPVIGALFILVLSANSAHAKIIREALDSFAGVMNPSTTNIKVVDSPRRAGSKAFRHEIPSGGTRAELGTPRVPPGSTNWYAWSFMHPSSPAIPSGKFTILMQMFMGNRPAGDWPCGGAGHKISAKDGRLEYHLQRSATGGSANKCDRIDLASFNEIKDKWVDVVIHVKWSLKSDGFLKLWMRIGGDSGTWVQKINYSGITHATGEEVEGPYFKMGAYLGGGGGGARVVYTDEYRHGDADSTFDDVAPGGKGTPTPTPQPELTHTIQLQQNWNLISLPINPSDTDIADVLAPINGQYVAVHAYDGKEYESYYPGNNDSKLKKMESGRGFWIFMNQAASLQIKGTKASKDVMLAKDWNLVGYNSQTPMSATQALASTGGKVSAVYSYDAVSNSYKVVDMFQPGSGYWMFASDNVKWTLP